VLKDNQADVGIHYSEDVDRESVASIRGFFPGAVQTSYAH
jgi:hypothetical protein